MRWKNCRHCLEFALNATCIIENCKYQKKIIIMKTWSFITDDLTADKENPINEIRRKKTNENVELRY